MPREPMSGRRPRRRAIEAASDVWQVARVHLHAWVGEKPEELRRPWLTIVVGAPSGLVLKIDLEMEAPAPDRVLAVLDQAMARPQVGPPGRPERVVCPEAELAAAIGPRLQARGIAVTVGETPELQQAVASLEEHLQGGRPPVPGLLETPGVTPGQVGRLFAAAADFYRAAPWRVLTDADALAVRFPAESARPRYVLVMGHGGIEYGLAVYRSPEQVAMAQSGLPAEALVGLFDHESLTYGTRRYMDFADLDAQERYGWEVVGPDAYPLPWTFTTQREIRRPGPEDLRWYEAVLRAIPRFVTEQLAPGNGRIRPAEATLRVPVGDGESTVFLRYPAEPGGRPRRRRRA